MTQLEVEQIDKKYNVRPFIEAPLSKSDIEPVQLDALDLSLYKDGSEHFETRKKLADQLEKSISTSGFFSVVNHGIDVERFESLKAIAQSLLEIPAEEQGPYLAGAWKSDLEDRTKSVGAERGAGFKPKGYWSMRNGVHDSIVHYNLNNMLHPSFFDDSKNNHHPLVKAHLEEIAGYFRYLHNDVLKKITYLCDIILEIPEGTIWKLYYSVEENDFERSGQGAGRFMLYHNMKAEDEAKVGKNWLRGHSDSGGFTFITSQPILSLQVRDYFTGEWRYVGHTPNAFIVNIADAMEFITGGYFKSSIHRVVSPPEDQKNYRRLVLIYFSSPKNISIVDPEALDSPKLARLGFLKPDEWAKITFKDWYSIKGLLFGRKAVNDSNSDEPNLVLLYGRLHERWHQAEANFTLEEARKRFKVIEI